MVKALILARGSRGRRRRCTLVRPYADSAARWTVRLNVGEGVVISVQQMDDDPTSSRLAAMLPLLLDGLDWAIREGLLDVERLPRDEALIVVAEQLGSRLWSGGPMSDGFAVRKSRDIVQGDQPPMLVVREEGVSSAMVAEGRDGVGRCTWFLGRCWRGSCVIVSRKGSNRRF